MRIDEFIPDPRLRELRTVPVVATPDEAWRVTRNLDLQEALPVRALFAIRGLPERLAARLKGRKPPEARGRIDDIVGPGSGFHLLAEDPGREVVIGAVGKFWQPTIVWADVTAATFASFAEPGYGKVAWNLRVDPRARDGSWITVDVRVTATDDESWQRFLRYWRLIGRGSRMVRRIVLGTLERKLGAAPASRRPLPGDELLPNPRYRRTHMTTIAAPPAAVWPWLVQMGCRRGGWYSFDRLDNGGVPSAERIVPELQSIRVGDILPAKPTGPEGFAVLAVEKERSLVLGSPSLLPGGGPDWEPWRGTWAFALEPIGDFATALSVRVRGAYEPSVRMELTRLALGAAHEIMEREQLRNLRLRSERQRQTISTGAGAARAPM